jgi:hypothetical protein
MTGIGIIVQFIQALNQSRPEGVEMNITHQFKKVGIFLS